MQDRPGVRIKPPLVLLAVIIASAIASLIAPMRIFRSVRSAWARLFGIPLIAAALAILRSAIRLMQKSGTNINPDLPAQALVQQGPFRYTRNPIYLGLTLGYIGLGILANTLWFIPFAAIFVLTLQTQVIRYEEAYLEAKFGEEYRRYKSQTRRWI